MNRFSGHQLKLAYWLALYQTPGVGPVTFGRLLNQFDHQLDRLFAEPALATGLSERSLSAIKQPDWDRVEQELTWYDETNRHIVTLDDPGYPSLLKAITDPPGLLFVHGDVSLLSQWQLAVVGSRNPSPSGKENAYEFARYMAQGGVAITSGLAMGVDAAAHRGALAANGRTIAVIGTGLDRVYPAKHRELAHEIVASGAIVSEFALGTSPKAEHFPRRNRIISGLSLGTLVAEAALQSGSLITARMALEQGREVFAIPGSIHNPLAKGCHQLIREGAKLVETARDIVEELGAIAAVDHQEANATVPNQVDGATELDEDYQRLLSCLAYDPIDIDSLVIQSGLTAEAVSSMLLLLELDGQVTSLPGGRYTRVGH